MLLSSCMSTRTIKPSGLKGISIGDEMPQMSMTKMLGHQAYDSLIDEGGYTWRAMVVNHPSGQVLVESDPFNQEVINRIQINASDLQYQKKVSVGSTIADLDEIGGAWFITHLPNYRRVDVTVNGLHFLIGDDFVDTSDTTALTREQIPRAAPILTIVLM